MRLTSKHNQTNDYQILCVSNSLTSSNLWREIPEKTQADLQGGNNERIRIRLKSYDHLTWAMSLMF